MSSPYNVTDLDPMLAAERGIVHRDMIAHVLRWTYIVKEAKIGDVIVDFGCGKGRLLEVLYRNKFKPKHYIGLDLREQTLQHAREEYEKVPFPHDFIKADLTQPESLFEKLKADRVVSFEVAEHIGKQNIGKFLKNFKACGNSDATYYLSTPNYDEKVGAAGNHTYDSGDGRGVAPQEFEYFELRDALEKEFEIVDHFGTFASQKDYKEYLIEDWQQKMFETVKKRFDSNLVSNIMATVIEPVNARNIMWVLKRK